MTLTPQSNSLDGSFINHTTFLYDCVRRGMWPFVPDMVDFYGPEYNIDSNTYTIEVEVRAPGWKFVDRIYIEWYDVITSDLWMLGVGNYFMNAFRNREGIVPERHIILGEN